MARALACLAVLALPCIVMGQGKLDRVREEVDRPREKDQKSCDNDSSTSDSTSCPSSPDTGSPGCNSSSSAADPLGQLFLFSILSPWMAFHSALDPGLEVDGAFGRYPYVVPNSGHMLLNRPNVPVEERPYYRDSAVAQWYSVRAAAEVGDDFDGLTRAGLRLFLDTDTRFGVKMDWDYYLERLPCGCYDDLWLGDITATFRFVQHEAIQMHTGLGARFLLDHGNNRGGFNFLYGFDYFPVEPAHVFGSFEAGTLGNAVLYRLHGGVGASWTHGEVFIGYDYLRIGGATLQGPFVGLRLWF